MESPAAPAMLTQVQATPTSSASAAAAHYFATRAAAAAAASPTSLPLTDREHLAHLEHKLSQARQRVRPPIPPPSDCCFPSIVKLYLDLMCHLYQVEPAMNFIRRRRSNIVIWGEWSIDSLWMLQFQDLKEEKWKGDTKVSTLILQSRNDQCASTDCN